MITEYKSCSMIEKIFLNFNGRIDTEEQCLSLCCESVPKVPGIPMGKTGKETIEQFVKKRSQVIAESKAFVFLGKEKKHTHTVGCAQCANFQTNRWSSDNRIHYVNLSMYPAPCQCRCIYCHVFKEDDGLNHSAVESGYNRMFDALDYAKNSSLSSGYVPQEWNYQWYVHLRTRRT